MHPTNDTLPKNMKQSAGFTLVELMVGMVLSLLGVIVIYQVLTNTQAYRRSTAGVSSAQQNGAISLYYLERDLRQAGYGIQPSSHNSSESQANIAAQVSSLFSCSVQASSGGTAFNFTMAPFVVTNGATANTPDTLTILYGNSPTLSGGVPLAPDMSFTGASDVWVQSIQGFTAKDNIVVANPPAGCEMSQVNVPCALVNPPNAACSGVKYSFSHTGQHYSRAFNNPYGPGVAAGTVTGTAVPTAAVYNLGQQPVLATYSVVTDAKGQSSLNRRDQFETDATGPITRPIADDVVNMKVQVGFSNGTYAAYAAGQAWSQVTSVRVAIVARSNLQEREVVKQAVNQGTLNVFPAIMNGATVVTPAVDMTLNADQQRYRYKVYITVVALRNLLWSPR